MTVMHELREMLCRELEEVVEQGELTTGSLEVIDKLTHSIKSIDTIVAMEEAGYDSDYRSYDKKYGKKKHSRMESKEATEKIEEMMEETSDPAVRHTLQKALKHMEG